jgi:hypothetical protein
MNWLTRKRAILFAIAIVFIGASIYFNFMYIAAACVGWILCAMSILFSITLYKTAPVIETMEGEEYSEEKIARSVKSTKIIAYCILAVLFLVGLMLLKLSGTIF